MPLGEGDPKRTGEVIEETVEFSDFDLAVIGDGEVTMMRILDRLAAGEGLEGLPGTVWRDGGVPKSDHAVPWCLDIDALPMPALDLLPVERYSSVVISWFLPKFVLPRPSGVNPLIELTPPRLNCM